LADERAELIRFRSSWASWQTNKAAMIDPSEVAVVAYLGETGDETMGETDNRSG
jgi:hypothetical protein